MTADFSHYILRGPAHEVVAVDLMTWAEWFGTMDNRRVASTETRFAWVSTVFLGLNHQWGKGPPLVFETMVFEREAAIKKIFGRLQRVHDVHECHRYSSWDDALAGHKSIVRRIEHGEAQALRLVGKVIP